MQLGMIGLGRMGASMVRRLLPDSHACVVHDVQPSAVAGLVRDGATGAASLKEMVSQLGQPRGMNARAMKTITPSLLRLPIGYHAIHPDVNLNVQMNRCFGLVGDVSMLDEMRTVVPRITTYADWHREFAALKRQALVKGQMLKAAYYLRSAEFFLPAGDPQRKPMREKFVQLVRDHYGVNAGDQHRVPYADGPLRGFLPVYRFTPAQPKGVVVFCGGFDSYLEELFIFFFWLRDAGYEVVAFEGPGQGGALFDAGLPMTHEWEKPVAAVLDHFPDE